MSGSARPASGGLTDGIRLIFLAAGAITGIRVCATMFVSGTLCWAVVVPILQRRGLMRTEYAGTTYRENLLQQS